jgi:hypothetical protein
MKTQGAVDLYVHKHLPLAQDGITLLALRSIRCTSRERIGGPHRIEGRVYPQPNWEPWSRENYLVDARNFLTTL